MSASAPCMPAAAFGDRYLTISRNDVNCWLIRPIWSAFAPAADVIGRYLGRFGERRIDRVHVVRQCGPRFGGNPLVMVAFALRHGHVLKAFACSTPGHRTPSIGTPIG